MGTRTYVDIGADKWLPYLLDVLEPKENRVSNQMKDMMAVVQNFQKLYAGRPACLLYTSDAADE